MIMTPSPCWSGWRSRGWTLPPVSSSGTPSSRATRSREALVRAWRDLPGLRDPERFDAWLYRLTVNACLDAARHRRRRVREVEFTPIPDASSHLADRDQLDRALGQLEPDLRAIVVLHYYLDLSLPETADALGVPVGTVKSRLHRALAALRVTVADHGVAPPPVPQGRYA